MNRNVAKKILIVEDEAPLLQLLIEKFTHEGYAAQGATNGEEGLACALAEHPDLILCDIKMPKMDGLAMSKALRQDSWGRDATIIFLTNLDDRSKVSDAVDARVFDYIVKSNWKIEDVVKKVKEKLG